VYVGTNDSIGEDDKAAYGKLSRLISDQSSVSLEQIKIVFGPENSYIATWNHGMLWHNLPRTLATQLRQREDSEAAVPRVVALGSRGTWFAIWGEDDMVYDLKGKYTSMLEMIKVSKPEDIKVRTHSSWIWSQVIYGLQYVAMDAFADKRYIIFYHDDTFSICTRRVDADSLLRRHDFRRQCQCTLNNTVLRIQKKARVAGSESTAILDFSPLTAEQLVAAGESSMASPLVVPTSELVHLNVEILSEQPKESEISNKLAADENMETTKYFDVDGEKGTSSKAETWREADAETLS